jgi:tRNA pseudouridine38-40 synthase
MRWFFRVEYDGGAFSGWQSQNNARSVQTALETAFGTVCRVRCTVVGSGRTDAGVHARAQAAHIDLPESVDIDKCGQSVNAILPAEIAVRDFKPVPDSFHARFSAKKRCYKYYIATRKTPLSAHCVWVLPHKVDWRLVSKNIAPLLGRHDFAVFCAARHGARTTQCTVYNAKLAKQGELRVFTICADRFLYRMVRSIIGTLIDIGRGAMSDSMKEILVSKDRKRAGKTAPARGLVLDTVLYKRM